MRLKQTLLFGGDTSVGRNSAEYLSGVMPLLKDADIRMLHLEEPFVKVQSEKSGADRTTASLAPLVGNVDLMTLCANHLYDFGELGVADSLDWCHENGIATSGGGRNLEEAEKLAIVERDGVRYGVLSYNAIGPTTSFADTDKGGCAYVGFRRAYILDTEKDWRNQHRLEYDIHSIREPVELSGQAMAHNFPDITSWDKVAKQIADARSKCDVLTVYFHKGYVHRVAQLADYEKPLCHMAVDNGADVVVSSHSHQLRGVELYKGKAIYHGLNAFVMWVPQLSPQFKGKIIGDGNEEWIKARIKRFGFVADPEYPTYPFHPDAIYCMAAKCIVENGRIVENRLVPIVVEKSGIPYPHGNDEKGQAFLDYLNRITKEEELDTQYIWDGEELIIQAK